MGHLVCIIGIDGSGKTTQALELTKYLRAKGLNAEYSYGRYVPILTRPLIVIGASIIHGRAKRSGKTNDFTTYTTVKKRILSMTVIRKLVNLLITAEYLVQLALKIRIPLQTGKIIIADRYVHDTVATDLAPNLNFDYDEIRNSIRTFLTVVPEPSILIYIRVGADVAYARKSDIEHIDYLKDRAEIFDFIAASYGAFIVDGEKELNEVQDEIREAAEHMLMMAMTKGAVQYHRRTIHD